MLGRTTARRRRLFRVAILIGMGLLVTVGAPLTDTLNPFPPGSRVEGQHGDALLVMHNLGTGAGLRANSEGGGPGLVADSKQGDGVVGRAKQANRSGVLGYSGPGIGVKGRSDNNDAVVGVTGAPGKSGVWGRSTVGIGVSGSSSSGDGVVGSTESAQKSGVFGWSTHGRGVTARSEQGTALFVEGTSIFKNYASFEGGHGDLAENYYGRDDLEGGDVVAIAGDGGMTLELARKADDTAVAGILSTAPSMKLRGQIDDAQGVPLVVAGRARCKVDASYGAIEPGQLLTTSPTPGHAMRARPVVVGGVELYRPGTIIGKALDGWRDGQGQIRVLVTLQ